VGLRHAIFSWLNRRDLKGAEAAWQNPSGAQQEALSRILRAHNSSGYLNHYGLNGDSSTKMFRERLPIVDYAELKPWISPLINAGNGDAPTTVDQNVSLFLKTSGTTGPAKLLPVTAAYEAETGRGRRIWTQAMLREHDLNGDGSHVTIISPMHEGHTAGGIPFGSNTGRIFKRQMGFIQYFAPVPYELFSLKDFTLRYYLIARFAAARFDVRTFTTANPSTVLLMFRQLMAHGLEIADDIEAGRICSPTRRQQLNAGNFGELQDSEEAINALERGLRPSPRRARQLREAIKQGPEGLLPKIWPKLMSVNCWLGGHAPFYMDRIRPFLETESSRTLVIRDPGFSASEGLFGIPLRSETSDGVLHVQGAFMEFIPEHESGSRTLLVNALEVGQRYRIIVTTGGGLWRYNMNDIIEVTGYHQKTPLVRFLYKAGGTLNITGEKVTEAHAITAATSLARGHEIEQICATLELSDPPRYVIAVEPAGGTLAPNVLAADWERAMSDANIEYAEKRESGRLDHPRAFLVKKGTFRRWRERKVSAGAPDGQVKLPPLASDLENLLKELHQGRGALQQGDGFFAEGI